MTILPKKKAGADAESGSDSEAQGSHSPNPATVDPLPENDPYHSPEAYYHRSRYDLSSSSGESSPELSPLNKRAVLRGSSASNTAARSKKPALDASPGYNSSEEYDGRLHTYPADSERECEFEQVLKSDAGLIIKKMRPDGACLFRSVADQVYGDQEMHSVVRNHCMDYMLKNADYFSQFITDEDFEHYVNRKRSEKCYGNNIEMQAMAEMYNRAIEVYQYSTDPINIFFGVYKTDNAPIRLSYHGRIHYNSVVDPYQATVGVGLGLAGHNPGLADKNLLKDAAKESEVVHIEQAMLEDKLRSSDWDTTYDALEESVARESYLSWLRENERRALNGTQSTSAAGRDGSSHYPSLPPPIIPSSSASLITPAADSALKRTKPQASKMFRVHSPGYKSPRGRSTPSPPGRSSSVGGSVRGSPYHSPRDSPRGGSQRSSLRGLSRNSNQSSPHSSVPNSPSPPPPLISPSSPQGSSNGSPNPRESSPKPDQPAPTQSTSAPLNLDFESGQVVSQLPYEYSSFLDLPPSALGLSEWEDDRVLAAVLAASQQEYIDSLKHNSRGAESL